MVLTTTNNESIKSFLKSDDPLSEKAMDMLLSYREEDMLVDYKENFDPDSEKEWIGITTDIMAFANTCGGYLVFGVKDATFELLGLSEGVTKILSDTNLVTQKVHRYISPHIAQLRTKRHTRENKIFVIFFIPESIGQTHIVIKEAEFNYPSGKRKTALRPGMIFVRRSGSNQIINPLDFEFLISRRIQQYKDILFDRIARVVEAPLENQVIIVSPDDATGDERRIVISDAPDAIPVKGLSFTVTPKTDEQEIDGLVALSKKDLSFVPRPQVLWRFYSKRGELSLKDTQLIGIAKFCLLSGVPAFFWVRGFNADKLKQVLLEAILSKADISEKATIVAMGAFLGRQFQKKLIDKLGKVSERIAPYKRQATSDPRELFGSRLIESEKIIFGNEKGKSFNFFLENKITQLAVKLADDDAGAMEKHTAHAIDCYLYARNDKYLGGGINSK